MVAGQGTQTHACLSGLCELWDADPALRKRVRERSCLILEKPTGSEAVESPAGSVSKTLDNCRYNAAALVPLMVQMADHQDSVPDISALVDELAKFYGIHEVVAAPGALNTEAWSFRYLFGKVKSLTYRETAPRVA